MPKLDIAVLGDSYKPNQKGLFLQDLENYKSELFIRLWQRKSQFNFIPLKHNNNFHCKDSSFQDGATCDESAVNRAIRDAGLSDKMARMVLAERLLGGGGGPTCIGGTAFHDTLHSGHLCTHESSHSHLGLGHDSIFMKSTGNYGAAGLNSTYDVADFAKINAVLNAIEPFPSPTPTINITSAYVFYTDKKTLLATATMTGLIQHVEMVIDGILKGVFMCWSRGSVATQNGIKYFNDTITSGAHTLEIRAIDINGKIAKQTTQFTAT